jgi:hypothetical protein
MSTNTRPPEKLAISLYTGTPSEQREPVRGRGELLYVDSRSKLAWVFLPQETQPTFGEISGASSAEPIYLGTFLAKNRHGALAYSLVPDAALSRLLAEIPDLPGQPTVPDVAEVAEALLGTYVSGPNPDLEILRAIGWYCSRVDLQNARGLSEALNNLRVADVASALMADSASPARDGRLCDELWGVLNERRVVMLLGGDHSGLGEFLPQFVATIPGRAPSGGHFLVDFYPEIYRNLLEYLTIPANQSLMSNTRCDLPLACLFMSLAYATYRALLNSPSAKRESLQSLIPQTETSESLAFAITYIHFLLLPLRENPIDRRRDEYSPVTRFLTFVARLLEASGTGHKLVVFFSFPGLTRWLTAKHGEEEAGEVARKLWAQLADFTLDNYDSGSGKLLPHSLLATSATNVRLLVEMRRPSLYLLGIAFCSRSILMLPPYSASELREAWRKRFSSVASDDIISMLSDATRGIPWLVEIVLVALDNTGHPSPMDLSAALESIERVVTKRFANSPSERRILLSVDYYVNSVIDALSDEARTDWTTLGHLNRLTSFRGRLPGGETYIEWIEAGLFWLKNPVATSSLRVFGVYPFVQAYPLPQLLNLILEMIKQGPSGGTLPLAASR